MKIFYFVLICAFTFLGSTHAARAQAPTNDDACNATVLPLSLNGTCASAVRGTTVNATTSLGLGFVNPVECGINAQPRDVWYKVTTLASGPGSNKLHFTLTAAGTSPMASGNITFFRGNGSCPSLSMTLLSGACINSGSAGLTSINLTANFLTPSTTYYLRVNTVRESDANGTFDVCAYLPIPTPPCVAYIRPLNNAINVPVNEYVTFEWDASPGATLYDWFVKTTNPLPPGGRQITRTKDSTKFLMYGTKYYWYVAPRNSTGPAVGCPVDSFTTAPPPPNCVPLTTSNCRTGDILRLVKLTGENGTFINSASLCSTDGYGDYTGTTNVQLAQNKSYSGLLHAGGAVHDFFTVWIDYNDDGYFTNNERVLNNLRQQWSAEPTPYTINVPANAPVGTHRMRVRSVFYAVNPAVGSTLTDPCNNYGYGETEDYTVTIIAAANAPAASVAVGTNNTCLHVPLATIDTASNNNANLMQLVDENNAVVAAIDANGNNLGVVQVTVYKNSGTIRTLANGTRVLDRNITIEPQFQPLTPVRVRLYLTGEEFAALSASDPSITGVGSLTVTKFDDSCLVGGSLAPSVLVAQTGNGTLGGDYYIDVIVSSFSNFYIHGGNSALPVSMSSFKGERLRNEIKLEWTTATESGNKGFELQRSADGSNFTTISFISSKASQGSSNAQLQYDYTDTRPMKGGNYYRLKQVDKDGNVFYSTVVLIKNTGTSGVTFVDVYPNPVKDRVKIKLTSSALNEVEIVISDMAGRIIRRKPLKLVNGDNFIDLNVAGMRSGQYLVKVICDNGCEGAVNKIVKE